VLVNANTGRVDHDDVAIISFRNRFKKPIPDTGLSPADEAVIAGGWRTITFRDFRPRRACSEASKDAIQDPPVVDTRNAARLVRKQWRNNRPFMVREFVAAACHQSSSFGSLESRGA